MQYFYFNKKKYSDRLLPDSYLMTIQIYYCYHFEGFTLKLTGLSYLNFALIFFVICSIFLIENIYYLSWRPHYYYVTNFNWIIILFLKKIYYLFKVNFFKSFDWTTYDYFLFLRIPAIIGYNWNLYPK